MTLKQASKLLWEQIRRLMAASDKSKWNTEKSLPQLLDDGGQAAKSPQELADIHLGYFAKIQGAKS